MFLFIQTKIVFNVEKKKEKVENYRIVFNLFNI